MSEPLLRTKLIEVQYWDCGDDSHSHTTKKGAERCIEKMARPTPQQRKAAAEVRRSEVLRRHRAGESFAAIGRDFRVGASAVRDTYRRAERKEQSDRFRECGDPFALLSERTKNALLSSGYRDIERISICCLTGEIRELPGIGPKSFREILGWLERVNLESQKPPTT